jgi:hypothetical protein
MQVETGKIGHEATLKRRLVLPMRIETWSLSSLWQRLVKTGGGLIKHARYYWLLLAESHLTRQLFAGMLRKIVALPFPAGQSECKAEQIWTTTLGRRMKCLRNRSEKGQLRALRANPMRNRHLSAPLETPGTNTG